MEAAVQRVLGGWYGHKRSKRATRTSGPMLWLCWYCFHSPRVSSRSECGGGMIIFRSIAGSPADDTRACECNQECMRGYTAAGTHSPVVCWWVLLGETAAQEAGSLVG